MKGLLRLICVLALCLGPASAWAKGDTLIVANPADAKILDPHMTTESASNTVMRNIYQSLVQFDAKGELVPVLCEKWERVDGGFKFFLRKGVKFHNGEEMTADDVVFTFKRATSPGTALKALAGYIDPNGIEKVDDYTVILKTTQPMGSAFLSSMNHPWASILNKKAVEQHGKEYGMNPVGTGKFKFSSWAKGDRITLERFDDYWGEKAKLKKIILRVVIEANSRTIELESGAVDAIQDLPYVDIKRIEDTKNLRVDIKPGQRLFHIGLDTTLKPYDDVRVRQAINMAINRAGIVKVVFKGYGEVATGPTSSPVLYAKTKETPAPPVDFEGAKKLLAEAGYPNGFKAQLLIADRADFVNIATVVQENLRRIGIDLEIKVYEWGSFIDVIKQPGHQPFIMNWWGGAPALDPFFFMNPPFHSSSPAITNRFFYKNPELDELLNKGVALADGSERQECYSKAWDILNRDLPWISLVTPVNVRGLSKSLKGITYTPSFIIYYGDAYFEE